MATFMYRFQNGDLPTIFHEMFTVMNDFHDYPTTTRPDIYRVPRFWLDTKKRAVSVKGAIIWNDIDNHIRLSDSLPIFKSAMKKQLIGTIAASS